MLRARIHVEKICTLRSATDSWRIRAPALQHHHKHKETPPPIQSLQGTRIRRELPHIAHPTNTKSRLPRHFVVVLVEPLQRRGAQAYGRIFLFRLVPRLDAANEFVLPLFLSELLVRLGAC